MLVFDVGPMLALSRHYHIDFTLALNVEPTLVISKTSISALCWFIFVVPMLALGRHYHIGFTVALNVESTLVISGTSMSALC